MHKAILLTLLLLPAPASGMGVPERNGFTMELGLGLGFAQLLPEEGDTESRVGLAPLSLSLGGFLNNSMALMFRISGTSYFKKDAQGDDAQFLIGFTGLHFQYWFDDRFFISGGPGFSTYQSSKTKEYFKFTTYNRGFGLGLRGGFSFANWENHSLRVSVELISCFFDGPKALGEMIILEWQWF